MKLNTTTTLLISAVISSTSLTASAGGLFGDGGIFRGSVGGFLDKHVEKPVLTPVAKAIPKILSVGAATASNPTVLTEDSGEETTTEEIDQAEIEENEIFVDDNTHMGMPGADSDVLINDDGNGVIIIDFGDLNGANIPEDLDPDTTTIIFD